MTVSPDAEPSATGADPGSGADLRSTGERIERLLVASDSAGPIARERAEELVRLVVDLYGAGLEQLLDIAHECGVLSDELLERLAGDELVSGLLLVHGLHPYAVEERIARALDDVRPYLGSHGDDVELVEVTDDGVVRLRMLGSCDGCPSSAVTVQLAVEGAITAAAPEVTAVEVAEAPRQESSVIPLDALTVRLRDTSSGPAAAWEVVARSEDVPTGRLLPVTIAGLDVVLCRLGETTYAYRDGCPACTGSVAGAAIERRLGDPVGTGVLTCPGCRAHYDIRRAGAGLDDPDRHLQPLPLLERDGTVEVAVPAAAEPAGVPA